MTMFRILTGDVIDQLRTLPDNAVHCVVTSPPYWGLRDYGTGEWAGGDPCCDHKPGSARRVGKTTLAGSTATAGHQAEGYRHQCAKCGALRQDQQIGMEPTFGEYVARLVEVFREVRRVLRKDGTLWLNLGDSYNGSGGDGGDYGNGGLRDGQAPYPGRNVSGLKPKDLVGIPWRVALALQENGWWLRSEIIWAKTAPMPESVLDRPTRSHEQIFLLSKSKYYFYDQEALREPMVKGASGSTFVNGKTGVTSGDRVSHAERHDNPNGRNLRDVWLLGPEPYPKAHFATFPTEIPRRAILAGTSARGVCPSCGAPWHRLVERTGNISKREPAHMPGNTPTKTDSSGWKPATIATNFWHQSCNCPPADPIPATVLDPFMGSGTTLAVAVSLGRRAIGIDLNPAYVDLALDRLNGVQIAAL